MRIVAALAVLVFAGQALADDTPLLVPGSRVRVSASSLNGPIRGTLAALADDSLTLEAKGKGAPLVIERSRITRLEISAGRRSRGRGALIGAAVGLGAGLLLTASTRLGTIQEDSDYLATGIALVFFTPALTLSGALVGVALPPGERWVKVPPQGNPGTGTPMPFGLRLVVRF